MNAELKIVERLAYLREQLVNLEPYVDSDDYDECLQDYGYDRGLIDLYKEEIEFLEGLLQLVK